MAETKTQSMPPQPPPYYYRQKKSRWWIPVLIIGIVILFIFLAIIAFFGMVGSFFSEEPVEVKPNTVLYLSMETGVDEYSLAGPFNFFGQAKANSLFNINHAIIRAKSDDNIKGIFFNANSAKMGITKTMEFLDVLEDFKTSGKFVYAYMDNGDESTYLKTLPADKIFMPEEGLMELNGYAISNLFLKGLLDTIGIDFYVLGFEDFKSAGETYSRKDFSDSSRLQLKVLLDQRLDNLVAAISKYRDVPEEKIRELLNTGIFTTDKLVEAGLIDEIASESEVKTMMKDMIRTEGNNVNKLRLMSIGSYLESNFDYPVENVDFDKQIAIIYGVGPIVQNHAKNLNNMDEKYITGKEFIRNLKKARENDNIKAIILRIDSPGGSALVSDNIYREILKTREIKPVYASMSDVAASGGYYISIGADTIVAHPTTITGSIGVVTAIPNFSRLIQKVYLTVDTISSNPAAMTLNPTMPFKDKDKQIIYKFAEGIYFRFLEKVSESRDKSVEEIRQYAKGRVWTGKDAKEIGLVDVLGGMQTAIDLAKARIGVAKEDKVIIKRYPEPEDDLKTLMKLLGLERGEDDEIVNSRKAEIMKSLANLNPGFFGATLESLPEDIRAQIKYMLNLIDISLKEHTMTAMPYYIKEY